MKIKAATIVSAVGVLKAIDTTAMKLSTSYRVKKVLGSCQVAIEDFEAKRIKLAEEHGTLAKDKTHYKFTKKGSQEAFQKRMEEMLEDEIDIDVSEKIPLELLDDYIEIEPNSIEFIAWFIEGLEDLNPAAPPK